jgi:hypothetical protein
MSSYGAGCRRARSTAPPRQQCMLSALHRARCVRVRVAGCCLGCGEVSVGWVGRDTGRGRRWLSERPSDRAGSPPSAAKRLKRQAGRSRQGAASCTGVPRLHAAPKVARGGRCSRRTELCFFYLADICARRPRCCRPPVSATRGSPPRPPVRVRDRLLGKARSARTTPFLYGRPYHQGNTGRSGAGRGGRRDGSRYRRSSGSDRTGSQLSCRTSLGLLLACTGRIEGGACR